jgi:RNA polymerase sigma factor (sigma-70 family)
VVDVQDEELVAAIVAGEAAALAAAYDRYAPPLYAYCQSLLSDPVEAADAVKDTFVLAAAKLGGLRDRSRLRPWLYAVARNECRRKLHGQSVARGYGDAPMLGDETVDFGTAMEQQEKRELVWSALAGMNAADQEVVELSLRHDLHGADLADVLGVPYARVEALDAGARHRFETALGALLMARSGEGTCPQLAEILAGWDTELTEPMSEQVRDHIGGCPICGEARRRQVNPVSLLRVLPVAVLPGGLRYELFQLLTGHSQEAGEYCVAVAARAAEFNRNGFPVPIDSPGGGRPSAARLLPVAAALAVALVAVGGGVALAAHDMHHSPGTAAPARSSTVPSTQPGAPVTSHRHVKARSVTGGNVPGVGASSAGASNTAKASAKATKPKASATKHTTAPTTHPPTSHPPTSHPPTTPPPTTPPPTSPAPTTPAPTTGAIGGLLTSFTSLFSFF